MIKVLELFAGIGAASKALANLGIENEIVDAVEIDKYAVKSFNAVHGTSFEPQDITEWDKSIDVDLVIHGSPCQDFSVAGRQAGGDEGSGTRSSLMYETVRIVEKLKPKYVIWENVKNLLSKKHRHNFDAYLETMEKLGYTNYYKVLDAQNYGVPQHRERIFTVSALDGDDFKFPEPIPLEKKLKDVLEKEVDEKYYISDAMLGYFMGVNQKESKFPRQERFLSNVGRKNQDIANSITTNAGQRPTDNFIIEDFYKSRPPREYQDVAPTIRAERVGLKVAEPNLKTRLCNELVRRGIVKGGEIINHSYTTSEQRDTLEKYIESTNGITPTLTTRPDILGYVEDTPLRIRKLTPLETWRLQGFDDESFKRAEKVNSNAQLYKQAGNSICVNVLMSIFKELFNGSTSRK